MHTKATKPRYYRTVIADPCPDFLRNACECIAEHSKLIVVATADTGRSVVITAKVLRPDLVLLDAAMPGVDGVEITRKLKALPDPPVVVLLTPDAPNDTVRTENSGADAVLSKSELRGSIDLILRAIDA